MSHLQTLHIAPSGSGWLVYRPGNPAERFFSGLGDALDAASSIADADARFRIVIHETPARAACESTEAPAA